MKRTVFPVVMLLAAAILVFGCSNEKAIERTIGDWTEAINSGDTGGLQNAVSPDSEMYDPVNVDWLINVYFAGQTPVSYSNLDINIDKPYADVPATANYNGFINPAMFVMKKKEGFFSFLNPEWNVYKYFDNNDFTTPVWKKLKK